MQQGTARYRQMDLTTASPQLLVAKLFGAAVRHTRRACELSSGGDRAERSRAISKALSIVDELRVSLDLERGGEIARNLASLYDFVRERLIRANARQQAGPLREALGILDTLEQAWSELCTRSGAGA